MRLYSNAAKTKIRPDPREENWVGPKRKPNLLPWDHDRAPSLLGPK